MIDQQVLMALVTLTAMEIVLSVDNVIFISILTGKLPVHQQEKARLVGLGLAMFIRIALLFSLSWLMGMTAPLFTVVGNEISGRDLVLIIGGLFLIYKSTSEIHEKLEGEEEVHVEKKAKSAFTAVILQILVIDIVFSLDSIITAIGMANQLWVMVAAVVIAVAFMMLFSGKISAVVLNHPSLKMLALSFLLLIGMALIADGLDKHIPKGYIYFSMAFSVLVEMLNMRLRKHGKPVKLHEAILDGTKN